MSYIISLVLTIISILITVVSIGITIYSIRRAKAAEKALQSITWEDIQKASAKIARKLIKTYKPAVIYIPNIKSGIMLQFVKNYFPDYIPIVVGHTVSKEYFSENDCNKIKGLESYWYVDTKKWYTYIPNILFEYKDQDILILDNLSLTGNFLNIITEELIKQGIPCEHIITACIATTEAAINEKVAPRYYYKTLNASKEVYMPWAN